MKSWAPVPVVIALLLCGCDREPLNYNDCILKMLNASMSDVVAHEIIGACKKKFQVVDAPVSIAPEDIAKFSGNLAPDKNNPSNWVGNLYNGTAVWRVTELTIAIYPKGNMNTDSIKFYAVSIASSPLTNTPFAMSVDWPVDEPFDWSIAKAVGYRVQK